MELNPGPFFCVDCSKTVTGDFHQGNVSLFGRNSGKQCVAMCLTAVVYNFRTNASTWSRRNLNEMLLLGNSLYSHLSNFARKDFLLLCDIPSALSINSEIFSVTFSDSSAGDLHMSGVRDCYVSLDVALNMLITEYNAFLLTIEISTIAIVLDSKGNYKLFDSHSRDIYGKVSTNGTSILLEFDTILEVVLYLQNLYSDRSVVSFEVIGVKVSCLPDHENSMNKTFGSQSDNPKEHTFSGAESCYQRHETSHPISNENENQKSVLYLKRNEKCEKEIVSIRQAQAPPEKTHFLIGAYKCNMEERESCG